MLSGARRKTYRRGLPTTRVLEIHAATARVQRASLARQWLGCTACQQVPDLRRQFDCCRCHFFPFLAFLSAFLLMLAAGPAAGPMAEPSTAANSSALLKGSSPGCRKGIQSR